MSAIRRRSSRRRAVPGFATSPPSSRTGKTQAIIVPKDSPIKTLADLKGKRVAFGKGSSAHNLLVAALEKAGLTWSDITPAPLAPADATAAFVKGSVDAWSIWDPYLALAELKENARVIAFDKDVHKPNAFYIASADFVEKYPDAGRPAQRGVRGGRRVGRSASRGSREGAGRGDRRRSSRPSGASWTARTIAWSRSTTRSIRSQQAVADRFARLDLIPKPINVSEIVWKWTPGA